MEITSTIMVGRTHPVKTFAGQQGTNSDSGAVSVWTLDFRTQQKCETMIWHLVVTASH